jgi:hypothetical protein
LADINGKIIEARKLNIVEGNTYTIIFNNASYLPKAIYLIDYTGPALKKTIKALKQ